MSQRSWGIAACAPAAFLFATSIAVTFTACSDDLMADNSQPVTNPEPDETLFEAYGLTSFLLLFIRNVRTKWWLLSFRCLA